MEKMIEFNELAVGRKFIMNTIKGPKKAIKIKLNFAGNNILIFDDDHKITPAFLDDDKIVFVEENIHDN